MKHVVKKLITVAVHNAADRGFLSLPEPDSLKIEVSRSKDPRFGDYASNVGLVLASGTKMKPRDLAQIIVDHLPQGEEVLDRAEVAGPGFINFFLAAGVWRDLLHTIHREKDLFGHNRVESPRRILLEFVSANPTGPLHVGHGRGAAVGDTLARLLRASGHNLETEYYVNDTGNQMRILGRSVLYRYKELCGEKIEFPENHYRGDYIGELAAVLRGTSLGQKLIDLPEEEAVDLASRYACDTILQGIKKDLADFRVTYDRYFSERSLHESGALTQTIEELSRRGKTQQNEGALWFTMEGQEDDKDRVLVRASGEPTYFAADAAYHRDKLKRGYDLLVDIWGSDHHGYVPRVKASVEALGYSSDVLRVLLVQFVTLVREGRKISMSTRSGEFVTLREVLDEVGVDAARFFFLSKRCDSHLDFDLELAKRQSRENPVYYVQYVHARVSSIFRIAAERGIDADMSSPDLTVLSLPEEFRLMKHLADFPDMLTEAAESLEPQRLTFYLTDLAELFHAYYHDNRVLIEDDRLRKARLFLSEAVRQVVANGLSILGVSAPERM